MKAYHYILLALTLLISAKAVGQTTGSDRYSEVTMIERGMKAHVVTTLDLGETDSIKVFESKSIERKLLKVEELESAPAVLNFMSREGWTLIATISVGSSGIRFFFRKNFKKSDLAQ